MIYSQDELLKLAHDTRAVSIWNSAKGPVFWYAANVPGPFYVNTEMMLGASLAEKLLREITVIVAGIVDAEARAEQLSRLILDIFKNDPSWQSLIATMIERARKEFAPHSFSVISGGERRDWLFSIPFAYVCDMPHLFLFKNKTAYCAQPLKAGQSALHVSDLINNAASYFEFWQPALQALDINCIGNLCVTLRGEDGLGRLREAGQKTVSLIKIDVEFFRKLHAAGLIDQAIFEELAIFFASSQDWSQKYLIGKPELFNAARCDVKSFERLRFFIEKDPWRLRPQNESFFTAMQKAIEKRTTQAA